MSYESETKVEVMRLPARIKTLVMVGVLGALITVVFVATLEAMQRLEPASGQSQLASEGGVVVAAAGTTSASRAVAPETLYLLLLGAMLLCVAAGVSTLASGNTVSASSGTHGAAGHIEPSAVIHAASSTR